MSLTSEEGFIKVEAKQISQTPAILRTAFLQKLSDLGLSDLDADLISENLLSPCQIYLPLRVKNEIENFIFNLFSIRKSPEYLHYFQQEITQKDLRDPGNNSILMSYDFHLNLELKPKLIEVNTNASFLALGSVMNEVFDHLSPQDLSSESAASFHVQDLCKNIYSDIESEFQLFDSPQKKSLKKIAIIDEQPQSQRLFAEFLLYKKIFEDHGWETEITDFSNLDLEKTDFVYNRYTDFYFREERSAKLRSAFLSKETCFSPNPFEYFLLADKERNRDWFREDFLNALNSEQKMNWQKFVVPHLLEVQLLNKSSAEAIWSKRKNLFFKPQSSFGSKQAFKGASISRTAFEKIIDTESVAQEFSPPFEVELKTLEGEQQKFKFDLRCFAYQGKLEMTVARLYQGQTTNLRTPYGGFAPVKFI